MRSQKRFFMDHHDTSRPLTQPTCQYPHSSNKWLNYAQLKLRPSIALKSTKLRQTSNSWALERESCDLSGDTWHNGHKHQLVDRNHQINKWPEWYVSTNLGPLQSKGWYIDLLCANSRISAADALMWNFDCNEPSWLTHITMEQVIQKKKL